MDNPLSTPPLPGFPPPTISEIKASLLADKKRVRVTVQINEVASRPDIELVLTDFSGEEITRSLIICIMTSELDFNLHLREYTVHGKLLVTGYLKKDDTTLDQKQVEVTQ